jgi:hypothetical protein
MAKFEKRILLGLAASVALLLASTSAKADTIDQFSLTTGGTFSASGPDLVVGNVLEVLPVVAATPPFDATVSFAGVTNEAVFFDETIGKFVTSLSNTTVINPNLGTFTFSTSSSSITKNFGSGDGFTLGFSATPGSYMTSSATSSFAGSTVAGGGGTLALGFGAIDLAPLGAPAGSSFNIGFPQLTVGPNALNPVTGMVVGEGQVFLGQGADTPLPKSAVGGLGLLGLLLVGSKFRKTSLQV